MAIFKKGNMWQRWEQVDLFCITTNATIKTNGALVMGRGIAQQMRDKFYGSDKALGSVIYDTKEYGLKITNQISPVQTVGAFQVKYHWSDTASIYLIQLATVKLFEYIMFAYPTPKCICLNFPGIGNGKLSRDAILPVVSLLPDLVEIWEFE